MEKTKKKTIEQSGVRKGSPMEGVGSMYQMNPTDGSLLHVTD